MDQTGEAGRDYARRLHHAQPRWRRLPHGVDVGLERELFGWAESKDLMAWSEQTEVPLMKDFPTVRQVWAPEMYWDEKAKEWLLIWSSSFTPPPEGVPDGLRIWASRTKDFKTFSKPALFFDRGFPAIDATMFHRDFAGKKDWVFVFKDQSLDPLRYTVRWTSGPSVEGPWGGSSRWWRSGSRCGCHGSAAYAPPSDGPSCLPCRPCSTP